MSYRQKKWCEEFIVDYNATAAARRAGYKDTPLIDRQAYQLLHNPKCEAYVAYLDKKKAAKLNDELLTPEYVVKKIIKAINKAEEKDQVMAVFRGAELLARHLGMLTDKQEVKTEENVNVKVQQDAQDFTELLKSIAKKKTSVELI